MTQSVIQWCAAAIFISSCGPSSMTSDAGAQGGGSTNGGGQANGGGDSAGGGAQSAGGGTTTGDAGIGGVQTGGGQTGGGQTGGGQTGGGQTGGGQADAGRTDGGQIATDGGMSFLSSATCNSTPCRPGTAPNATGANACTVGPTAINMIGLGNVNNGAANECRMYGFYRPANLVGRAPAIVVSGPGSNWITVANANRLMLLILNPTPRGGYLHPFIDMPPPDAGSQPSDGPYVAAVVADAITRFDIDPARLILTGDSTGGALTFGIACDPTYSPLFRGYASVSAEMQVALDAVQAVSGTERCSSANWQYFMLHVVGTADRNQYPGVCTPNHCVTSFTEANRFWSQYLGCGANPTTTLSGTPQAQNTIEEFSNCSFGQRQFETVLVENGGHTWTGLDDAVNGTVNTNGFVTAETAWSFFATRRW